MTTEVQIDVYQDGMEIPGFPFFRAQEYRQLFAFFNKVTDTVNYNNILPSLTPTETVQVGLLIISADKDVLIAIRDSVPDEPFTLTAGRLLVIVGGQADHSVATPFCRIRCSTSNTTLHVIAGLL